MDQAQAFMELVSIPERAWGRLEHHCPVDRPPLLSRFNP